MGCSGVGCSGRRGVRELGVGECKAEAGVGRALIMLVDEGW